MQLKPIYKATIFKGPLETKDLGMTDEKTGRECFKKEEAIHRNVNLNHLLPKQEGTRGCLDQGQDQDQDLRKQSIGATGRREGVRMRKKGV